MPFWYVRNKLDVNIHSACMAICKGQIVLQHLNYHNLGKFSGSIQSWGWNGLKGKFSIFNHGCNSLSYIKCSKKGSCMWHWRWSYDNITPDD